MPDRIRDYKTAGCNMQQPPECSDDSRKIWFVFFWRYLFAHRFAPQSPNSFHVFTNYKEKINFLLN